MESQDFKKIRKSLNLTQKEMGKKLGVFLLEECKVGN